MPKRFDIALDRYQVATLVGAVRTKRDVIALWMNAIKSFLADSPAPDHLREAKLSIVVKAMSRLFCELEGGRKIFSVGFPFTVQSVDGELQFRSREGILIDNRVSSGILSLIEDKVTGVLSSRDFYQFIDPLLEAIEIDPAMWTLLRELMLAEDAYLRYDWDEKRADGHKHPIHHIDLCYSAEGTFKLGLKDSIDQSALIEILDIEVDCHYLHPVT